MHLNTGGIVQRRCKFQGIVRGNRELVARCQRRTHRFAQQQNASIFASFIALVCYSDEVVEMGSHDDLLLQRGRYAHLVMTQLTGALPNTLV
jgi:hypothetical protein